ncbi:MAG: hypothetical protein ABI870_11565 [Rhodanobacter sp.]
MTTCTGFNGQAHRQPQVRTPSGGTILHQGGVTRLALMAKYDFSLRTSLQLNANNVLDRRYYVLDEYDNTYYGAPANLSLTRLTF